MSPKDNQFAYPTICFRCENFRNLVPGSDDFYNHLCTATICPERTDFVTGKITPPRFDFCNVVNWSGHCTKYEPKEQSITKEPEKPLGSLWDRVWAKVRKFFKARGTETPNLRE